MSTSSAYTLRTAEPQDVAAIAALLTQLNRAEGYDTISNPNALRSGLFPDEAPVKLRALLAQKQGKVVATALYYSGYDVLTASYGYHLADFVVEESCRRQGIGRALMVALAKQNLEEGGAWMSLTVLKTNESAKQFYLSLGLVEVKVDFCAIGTAALRRLAG